MVVSMRQRLQGSVPPNPQPSTRHGEPCVLSAAAPSPACTEPRPSPWPPPVVLPPALVPVHREGPGMESGLCGPQRPREEGGLRPVDQPARCPAHAEPGHPGMAGRGGTRPGLPGPQDPPSASGGVHMGGQPQPSKKVPRVQLWGHLLVPAPGSSSLPAPWPPPHGLHFPRAHLPPTGPWEGSSPGLPVGCPARSTGMSPTALRSPRRAWRVCAECAHAQQPAGLSAGAGPAWADASQAQRCWLFEAPR